MNKFDKLYTLQSSSQNELDLYQFLKRVFDVTVSLIVLPIAIPAMLVITLLIYLDSPSAPIFIQDRVGKGNKKFRIFKFRTLDPNFKENTTKDYMQAYITGQMSTGENNTGNLGKPITTHQMTRIGRILRKTSLDELPQLINVLIGNMSLVGPRPNVPWEVSEYRTWHHERLDVLPGITGLAQVYGRSNIPFNELVKYDVQYIQNRNFILDLRIIWMTFKVAISRSGAG